MLGLMVSSLASARLMSSGQQLVLGDAVGGERDHHVVDRLVARQRAGAGELLGVEEIGGVLRRAVGKLRGVHAEDVAAQDIEKAPLLADAGRAVLGEVRHGVAILAEVHQVVLLQDHAVGADIHQVPLYAAGLGIGLDLGPLLVGIDGDGDDLDAGRLGEVLVEMLGQRVLQHAAGGGDDDLALRLGGGRGIRPGHRGADADGDGGRHDDRKRRHGAASRSLAFHDCVLPS